MEGIARVVLAVASPQLASEVVDFLDRTGRARVVATVSSTGELLQAVRRGNVEAVVAEPAMAPPPGSLNGSVLLAVDTSESVRSLREALDAGARGYFLWPSERADLAAAAAHAAHERRIVPARLANTFAVYGPRGGVGATFVATHLAAALGRLGHNTLLVDLDHSFGDAAAALGAPEAGDRSPEGDAPGTRTIADLVMVADELEAEHIEGAMWRHPSGFGVLLAPPAGTTAVDGRLSRAVVHAGAETCDAQVVHLARALDEIAMGAFESADVVVMVLGLDLLSFRDGRRAMEVLTALGLEDRCRFVVNRSGRSALGPGDVDRVFGRAALATIPSDRRVPRLQDRGALLPARSRVARALLRLARRLMEEGADGRP